MLNEYRCPQCNDLLDANYPSEKCANCNASLKGIIPARPLLGESGNRQGIAILAGCGACLAALFIVLLVASTFFRGVTGGDGIANICGGVLVVGLVSLFYYVYHTVNGKREEP
jgi:hypothetical protein